MRILRRGVVVGLVVVAFLGGMTLLALEGTEVVVLRTIDERGVARETRTWIADADGAAWIEAATPDRPFLRQLRSNPNVELQRAGHLQHCRAVDVPNPEGHTRIRQLLAEKYGWADWWIGKLTDTSASLAVRLDCH